MEDPLGMSSATGPTRRHADPDAVRELLTRTAGGGGSPERVDTHETHISWVFVVGERAFKLRKPVVLEFLDYGTPARRRAMGEAEVELGRRLAPHIYRAVRAIVAEDDRLALAPADDPRALDYVVEMTAFAQDATLAAAVHPGTVPAWVPQRLGARLASFHAACPGRPVERAATLVRREFAANLDELRELGEGSLDRPLDRLARFLDASVTAHGRELDTRGDEGRRREGHGDLRAEHVLLAPELAVIDCLEFDVAFRTLDTADELAFLVMDLLRLGAEPLGRAVLDAYREAGGDCGEDALVWMFAAHRALVRTKVAVLRAQQVDAGASAADAADEGLAVADRCAWRGRSIEVLVICGGSATGKSLLTGRLGERLGVPGLNTDVVRKELLGLPAQARAGADAYTPEMGLRTYAELGSRTRALLADHPTVIVDGTFLRRPERAAFSEGLGGRPSVVFVQCCVPPEVARDRARERAGRPERVSDATEAIVAAQGAGPDALSDVAPAAQILLRTDRDPAAIEADLDAMLDARLVG